MSNQAHDRWLDNVMDRCDGCEHNNNNHCTMYLKDIEDVEYCKLTQIDQGEAIDHAEWLLEDR